jgi:hypothetical protein
MNTISSKIDEKTVWTKQVLQQSVVDDTYGLATVYDATVTCVEETSGFAVWYHRNLNDQSEVVVTKNGDYLLKFFALELRDDAIEFAVLMAQPTPGYDDTVAMLDGLAKGDWAMIQ